MSKLQKFNQILFAIIGSGIVLFASYGLILVAIDYNNKWKRPDNTPLSDQKVTKLAQDNKFMQTISYQNGYWAWKEITPQKNGPTKVVISPYYIIPVSQTTLENVQKMNPLADSRKASIGIAYRKSGAKYNNILIYNTLNGSIKKIFDQRLMVSDIDVREYHDEYFAIIQTQSLSKKESPEGPRLKSYYIYNFSKEKLTKFTLPKLGNVTFITDENLPQFLIRGRTDFDKNGKIDNYDPFRLFLWNYETYDVTPFPDDAITDDLQKTLEGHYLKNTVTK